MALCSDCFSYRTRVSRTTVDRRSPFSPLSSVDFGAQPSVVFFPRRLTISVGHVVVCHTHTHTWVGILARELIAGLYRGYYYTRMQNTALFACARRRRSHLHGFLYCTRANDTCTGIPTIHYYDTASCTHIIGTSDGDPTTTINMFANTATDRGDVQESYYPVSYTRLYNTYCRCAADIPSTRDKIAEARATSTTGFATIEVCAIISWSFPSVHVYRDDKRHTCGSHERVCALAVSW